MGEANERLVDAIYEAAVVPEQWTSALEEVCAEVGAVSSTLINFNGHDIPPHQSTSNVAATVSAFLQTGLWKGSLPLGGTMGSAPRKFLYVEDYISREAFAADPVQRSIRDAGLGHQIGARIDLPQGGFITFSFESLGHLPRPTEQQEKLSSLWPHFARAAWMLDRFETSKARQFVSTLESIGIPAAIADANGSERAHNSLFKQVTSQIKSGAQGRLYAADPAANALLQAGLKHPSEGVQSFPVPGEDGRADLVIHLLPIRRQARDVFSSGQTLITAKRIGSEIPHFPAEILKALFDLSATEAGIALHLANGMTLQEAAAALHIQYNSARTYMNGIFLKTGTHQQSQLVALVRGLQPLS